MPTPDPQSGRSESMTFKVPDRPRRLPRSKASEFGESRLVWVLVGTVLGRWLAPTAEAPPWGLHGPLPPMVLEAGTGPGFSQRDVRGICCGASGKELPPDKEEDT